MSGKMYLEFKTYILLSQPANRAVTAWMIKSQDLVLGVTIKKFILFKFRVAGEAKSRHT